MFPFSSFSLLIRFLHFSLFYHQRRMFLLIFHCSSFFCPLGLSLFGTKLFLCHLFQKYYRWFINLLYLITGVCPFIIATFRYGIRFFLSSTISYQSISMFTIREILGIWGASTDVRNSTNRTNNYLNGACECDENILCGSNSV